MIIVGLTNQVQLQSQLLNSPKELTDFSEGATVSMETNDGFLEDGQTIFEVDEFDMDLLEGSGIDVEETI